MGKVSMEGVGQFYHHYPRVATIVTVHAGGKDNAMAVAWHTSISFEPPLYGISISPKRFTYELILEAQEFGVNFISMDKAEVIASVGGISGRDVDKFQRFGIATEKPLKTSVPILKDAYVSLECKLIDDRNYGDHNMMVGEVVAVHTQEGAFTAEGVLDLNLFNPALFLGIDYYLSVDKNTLKFLDRKVHGRC